MLSHYERSFRSVSLPHFIILHYSVRLHTQIPSQVVVHMVLCLSPTHDYDPVPTSPPCLFIAAHNFLFITLIHGYPFPPCFFFQAQAVAAGLTVLAAALCPSGSCALAPPRAAFEASLSSTPEERMNALGENSPGNPRFSSTRRQDATLNRKGTCFAEIIQIIGTPDPFAVLTF